MGARALSPLPAYSAPGEKLSLMVSASREKGEETLERGEAPLLPTLPLPLLREGGQGDRLLNDLKQVGF